MDMLPLLAKADRGFVCHVDYIHDAWRRGEGGRLCSSQSSVAEFLGLASEITESRLEQECLVVLVIEVLTSKYRCRRPT